ncbi:hypothetical protein ACE6H2_023349 [Prunus campanulata]
MHVAYPTDANWYPDSGATHHMIGDARSMTSTTSYGHNDQVTIGNGDSLPITHIGNMTFSSGAFVFRLSDVLHVLSVHKNLLSVAQFTRDNLVSLTFFPWGFVIRDLKSSNILFQGPCKDGLYTIRPALASHFTHASKSAFISSLDSASLWQRRLGHPSNKVLRQLVSRLPLGTNFHLSSESFCSHCVLAKSVRLSFSSREHCSVSPFELVHSDVWMSPINSISGFRYYVLFTDDFTRYS